MLTFHQRCFMAFTWEHFHMEMLSNECHVTPVIQEMMNIPIIKMTSNITFLKSLPHVPGANELIWPRSFSVTSSSLGQSLSYDHPQFVSKEITKSMGTWITYNKKQKNVHFDGIYSIYSDLRNHWNENFFFIETKTNAIFIINFKIYISLIDYFYHLSAIL